MDDSIKESQNGKWKGLFKGDKDLQKNGNSCLTPLATTNGNNCSDKEKPLNGEIVELTEEEISCGVGPCSPKWLQVIIESGSI